MARTASRYGRREGLTATADVFVSYSRDDSAFVRRLVDALKARGSTMISARSEAPAVRVLYRCRIRVLYRWHGRRVGLASARNGGGEAVQRSARVGNAG
jgi:hypothetical protein